MTKPYIGIDFLKKLNKDICKKCMGECWTRWTSIRWLFTGNTGCSESRKLLGSSDIFDNLVYTAIKEECPFRMEQMVSNKDKFQNSTLQ